MKKRLLFQGIYIFVLSTIITLLVVAITSSLFISSRDIIITNKSIESEALIIRDGTAVYTSKSFSPAEIQNILLVAKNSKLTFSSGGIKYSVMEKTFPDGTSLLRLSPVIDFDAGYKTLQIFFGFVFTFTYFVLLFMTIRKNNKEIVCPLVSLRKRTQQLAKGSLDENIPDEGTDEINLLCKEIEALRLRLKKEVYFNKKSAENRKFLISSMSHDLRTPVTSLRGYLEGIIDGVATTEEKRNLYVRKSLEKTELINQMIGDLLLYSKLDLNQVEFTYRAVDIADYLAAFTEDSIVFFEHGNKKICLTNELAQHYSVNIDVQQFDRVMNNITTNAFKYIAENTGIVNIFLRENNSSVIIEVRDNGSGICAEDLPKIFDRFYRCEKSRQIKGSSGLGLAISKQIIENMNGRIWAVSKENSGTSILISLKKYNH